MSILANDIKKRYLNKKRNCLIIIWGEVGTGKSWTSGSILESLDPSFTALERVTFDQENFFQKINAPEKEGGKKHKLKKGMAVMYEEAGTSVDSRSWWLNKEFSHLLETFRNRQLVVVFTVPHIKMIDKNVRGLANYHIQTKCVLPKEKKVRVQVKRIKITAQATWGGEHYIGVYLRHKGKRIRTLKINRPSKLFAKQYEPMAKEWKHNLARMKEAEIKKKRVKEDNKDKVMDVKSRKKWLENLAQDMLLNRFKEYFKPKGKGYSFCFAKMQVEYPELKDYEKRYVRDYILQNMYKRGDGREVPL